jgi:hypothetical protein
MSVVELEQAIGLLLGCEEGRAFLTENKRLGFKHGFVVACNRIHEGQKVERLMDVKFLEELSHELVTKPSKTRRDGKGLKDATPVKDAHSGF